MENAQHRLREFYVRDKFSCLTLPRATVLLPLVVRGGRLHLLLTVRSMQVPGGLRGARSFPGNHCAAETRDVCSPCRKPKTNFEAGQMSNLVTPVVGFVEDTFQVTPNPDEVSEVFVVPLEYFVKPLNYNTFAYKTSSGYLTQIHCFT
ncbi:peroxisomal coenzyme A diphosphatase NUDT7-like [Anomalospiza imberbis]|uniref:peroxisomal coenzyme A diphosphatase NUDT7-like n=1 Tax=Anomalospiza imberbis TaxID=187417 RepID=UPI00358FB391